MKALFYDNETSDMPLFREPSSDPRQPHIVQLAAILVDLDTRERIDAMNVLVRPDGWEIAQGAGSVHGISMERAMDEGVPESEALDRFMSIWDGNLRIGHNESFDARMIRIALKRFQPDNFISDKVHVSDHWKECAAECTAKMSRPILGGSKNPKLVDAYRFFTETDHPKPHDAMADAEACMAVYFKIKDRTPVAA